MKRDIKTIDSILSEKNIKRLDAYVNISHKIKFLCLKDKCKHSWITSPNAILNGNRGCAKCSRSLKLTNKDVDDKILSKNIKRLDNYINNNTKINFQCLIVDCNYIWKTNPRNILNMDSGCPRCSGLIKLTLEYIDDKLYNKKIKRLSEYFNCNKEISLQCMVDCHIWNSSMNSIINKNHGCPKCSGNALLTNNDIDLKLTNRNIQRLDNYINNITKISFKCLNCHFQWKTLATSIINTGTGCPRCNLPGINAHKIYDILKINNIDFEKEYNIKNININEKHRYRLDYYFPSNRLAIEYNGAQHYEPRSFGFNIENSLKKFYKQQDRDEYIRCFCKIQNIKLIEIDGRFFKSKKLEDYLINILKQEGLIK